MEVGGAAKVKGSRSQPRRNRGTVSAVLRTQTEARRVKGESGGGVDEFGKREGTETGGRRRDARREKDGRRK